MQAEGIFRINAENGQEEFVREQLNRGIVPDGIDVHCLAGLIKVLYFHYIFFFRIIFPPQNTDCLEIEFNSSTVV